MTPEDYTPADFDGTDNRVLGLMLYDLFCLALQHEGRPLRLSCSDLRLAKVFHVVVTVHDLPLEA